jgi:hypothetical protein
VRDHRHRRHGERSHGEGEQVDREQDAVDVEEHEHRESLDRVHDHGRPDAERGLIDVVDAVHPLRIPPVLVLVAMPPVRAEVTDEEVQHKVPCELAH